ncbi:MAG TPA: hypothetical protein VLE99_02915 [Candidatus Saccharimonadales bacterium]|nr:hypothetical protein [Candidatus Saccharimonadales bacterium]
MATSRSTSPRRFSRQQTTTVVDTMAYVLGVGGNVAVIPQIIKAWQSDAPGLAVVTWVLFSAIGVVWLVYAILHRQKPLIVAQATSIACNLLVVSGWLFNHWVR